MKLTIHRGSHQIGGSIVSVSTAGTRVILDVGCPLETMTDRDPKEPLPEDPVLASAFRDGVDAVLLSHAHSDHSGLLAQIPQSVPLYLSRGTSKMLMAGSIYAGQADGRGLKQNALKTQVAVQIGDIKVTPFAVDHSAFDSMAYLLEADGRRLLYSGDLRMHGRKPGMIQAMIKAVAQSPLDALVIEGTNISPDRAAGQSEYDLEKEICNDIDQSPGLVLASFSPMHVDRLVSFYKATRDAGRKLVLDVYGAFVMYLAAGQARLPDPRNCPAIRVYRNRRRENPKIDRLFVGNRISLREILGAPRDYVMLFRPSMLARNFGGELPPRVRCIYSYWNGYLERDDWQSAAAKIQQAGGDLVQAHTSGHLRIADWIDLIHALNPRAMFPIHTRVPEEFRRHFDRVEVLVDGQEHEIV